MRVQIKKKAFLLTIFFSIFSWYVILIFLIDFGGIYSLKSQLRTTPLLSHLNPLIDESIDNIFRYNPRFSRPFDIVFSLSYFQKETLPRYKLIVTPNNLQKLERAAQKALQIPSGFLTDEFNIEVPATFTYHNKKYLVKVRYRGDIAGHWRNHKKSWKIIFKDPQYFQNEHIVNLIIPENRGYLDEALSKHVSRNLNLLTKDDKFVLLTINGEDLGIYYQTEQFGKDFLEKRKRAEGNLYGDRFGDVSWSAHIDLVHHIEDWKKLASNPTRDENNYSDLNKILSYFNSDSKMSDRSQLLNSIDRESFLHWQAHSVLMGSAHQDDKHNMKLYANPTTGLFEFIPDDTRFLADTIKTNRACNTLDLSYNTFVNTMLSDSSMLLKRNKILWKYISNDNGKDAAFFNDLYSDTRLDFYKGLRTSSIAQFENSYRKTKNALPKRYKFIKELLQHPPTPVATVQNKNEEIIISFDSTGPTGFLIETISVPSKDNTDPNTYIINEVILPSLKFTKGESCISYGQKRVKYSFPCTNCTKNDVAIAIKNLVTNEPVIPIIQYEK